MSSPLLAGDRLAPMIERTVHNTIGMHGEPCAAVGVDVVDLDVLERQLRVSGDRFLARLLVPAEIAYCNGRLEQLATRIAAKEAAVKALRSGFRGVGWHEIEIVSAANGAPSVLLHGRAGAQATRLGVEHVHVSFAHEGRLAVAVAIASPVAASESTSGDPGGEAR